MTHDFGECTEPEWLAKTGLTRIQRATFQLIELATGEDDIQLWPARMQPVGQPETATSGSKVNVGNDKRRHWSIMQTVHRILRGRGLDDLEPTLPKILYNYITDDDVIFDKHKLHYTYPPQLIVVHFGNVANRMRVALGSTH